MTRRTRLLDRRVEAAIRSLDPLADEVPAMSPGAVPPSRPRRVVLPLAAAVAVVGLTGAAAGLLSRGGGKQPSGVPGVVLVPYRAADWRGSLACDQSVGAILDHWVGAPGEDFDVVVGRAEAEFVTMRAGAPPENALATRQQHEVSDQGWEVAWFDPLGRRLAQASIARVRDSERFLLTTSSNCPWP